MGKSLSTHKGAKNLFIFRRSFCYTREYCFANCIITAQKMHFETTLNFLDEWCSAFSSPKTKRTFSRQGMFLESRELGQRHCNCTVGYWLIKKTNFQQSDVENCTLISNFSIFNLMQNRSKTIKNRSKRSKMRNHVPKQTEKIHKILNMKDFKIG